MKNLKKTFKKLRKSKNFKMLFTACAVALLVCSSIVYTIFNQENHDAATTVNPFPLQSTSSQNSRPSIASSTLVKPSTSINIDNTPEPPKVPGWSKAVNSLQFPVRKLVWDSTKGISYKPYSKPVFQPNNELNKVGAKLIRLIDDKKLSKKDLSITLIDASSKQIYEYQGNKPMFPASIAKMFWLTALQGQIHKDMWKNPEVFDPFIKRMMLESDNDSSSFIIDNISGSYSSLNKLNPDELKSWLNRREFRINSYFTTSDYDASINLTQKTYPIPYLDLSEPAGNELQIRSGPNNSLIRNKLTTFDTARLMYEICYTKQAVSEDASKKMCSLLERKVDKSVWSKIKPEDFNPVESFFGESLPSKNVKFYSKAGWTPKSRSEVCLVEIVDKKKFYILAVFADDPSFGKDKTIFPEISKLVYNAINSK
jgi:hypothetical protein